MEGEGPAKKPRLGEEVVAEAPDADAAPAAPAVPAAPAASATPAALAAPAAPAAPAEPAVEGCTEEGGEREADSPEDARPRLATSVLFHAHDTTLNVLQSNVGGILMAHNEGGLQHFFAGARASVGISAGRHLFEVRAVEALGLRSTAEGESAGQQPLRHMIRVGVSTDGGLPLVGDNEEGVCFDVEGNFLFNKRMTAVAERVPHGSVMGVVLNLDSRSPKANTISLFRDGKRICEPQVLPEALRGKTLFPTVTFRNAALQCSFGPQAIASLPFACRLWSDVAREDAVVAEEAAAAGEGGRFEAVFPVCLPEEGGREWLEDFLAKNPRHAEVSHRMLATWAERSGLRRSVCVTPGWLTSNDRPDLQTGIPHIDDGSVKYCLLSVLPLQKRHLVLVEMKGNLLREERKDLVSKFRLNHRKVAMIMVGEPAHCIKEKAHKALLREKQERLNSEWKVRTQLRREQKRAESECKRQEAEDSKRRKAEEEATKEKAAEQKIAEGARKEGGEVKKDGQEVEKKPEEEAEKNKDKLRETIEEVAAEEEEDEPMPEAELTVEEKLCRFLRAGPLPDIAASLLNSSFSKFSLPEASEGFEAVEYAWAPREASEAYLAKWVLEKKLTTRIEDLQPSALFKTKLQEWHKELSAWHIGQLEYKDPVKRAAKAAAFDKNGTAAEATKEGEDSNDSDKAKDVKDGSNEEKNEKEESEQHKQVDALKRLEEDIDANELDVFGVDDIMDVGKGDPLFSRFALEDWAMLSIRFEIHLLVHAFKHDCADVERVGIPPEHLVFYYQRYYKKVLNPKNFGVDTAEGLVDLVGDAVIVNPRTKVIESQITADLEGNTIFVKLAEEMRRDRSRRVEAGDESARLHLTGPARSAGEPPMTLGPTPPGFPPPAPMSALGVVGMRPSMSAPPGMDVHGVRPPLHMPPRPPMGGKGSGVCRDFQHGLCTRGAVCRYLHSGGGAGQMGQIGQMGHMGQMGQVGQMSQMGPGRAPGLPGAPGGLQHGMQQGLQQGLQQGMPQSIQQGMQQGVHQAMQQAMLPGMPQGIQPGIQQGMRPGMPQVIQPGMPLGIPHGMQQSAQHGLQSVHQGMQRVGQPGMHHSMQQGPPHGLQQGMPQGMQQGMAQPGRNIQPGMQHGIHQHLGMSQLQAMHQQQGMYQPQGMHQGLHHQQAVQQGAQGSLGAQMQRMQAVQGIQPGMQQGMQQGFGVQGTLGGIPGISGGGGKPGWTGGKGW